MRVGITMKITGLTQQKNKTFYNLFADGEFFCSVDDELIIIHHLFIGKEIDGNQIVGIKKEAALRKAFNIALKYVSYKMRTQHEVEEYLRTKEFEESVVLTTMEKLKYYKYVDDDNYSLLYIRSKIAEGHSKRKIQYNLLKKGLAEESVRQQLELNYPKDIEVSYLKIQIEKLDKKFNQLPYRDRVSKISQSFQRKGYNCEDITKVMNEIISQENEYDEEFMKRLEKVANSYMEKYSKKSCDSKEVKYKTTQALYRKGYDIDAIKRFFHESNIN